MISGSSYYTTVVVHAATAEGVLKTTGKQISANFVCVCVYVRVCVCVCLFCLFFYEEFQLVRFTWWLCEMKLMSISFVRILLFPIHE